MTDTPEAHEEAQEYRVMWSGLATTYVTVTAKTPLEATDLAYEKISNSLCHHCTHPEANGFRSTGDVDREWPEYMEVTEVTVDGVTVDSDEY